MPSLTNLKLEVRTGYTTINYRHSILRSVFQTISCRLGLQASLSFSIIMVSGSFKGWSECEDDKLNGGCFLTKPGLRFFHNSEAIISA